MATPFAALTPSKLRDELITHPLMLCIGSLGLSTFMSQSIYGTIDWRPVSGIHCRLGRLALIFSTFTAAFASVVA